MSQVFQVCMRTSQATVYHSSDVIEKKLDKEYFSDNERFQNFGQ